MFDNGYYFDGGIAKLVSGPLRPRSPTFLERPGVDHGVIDGAVNGVGRAFRGAGGGLRKVQTGLVRNYALAIVLGVVGAALFLDDEGDADDGGFPIPHRDHSVADHGDDPRPAVGAGALTLPARGPS